MISRNEFGSYLEMISNMISFVRSDLEMISDPISKRRYDVENTIGSDIGMISRNEIGPARRNDFGSDIETTSDPISK